MLLYSTQRIVLIPSKFLTITYYLIVALILAYIGIYGLAISKGYQTACPVQSVVTTKVKGTLSTLNIPSAELKVPHPEYYKRIWDANDLVTPGHGGENGGFFVMTNVVITPNQTRDVCPESHKYSSCRTNADCKPGESIKNGNGVMTGKCVRFGTQQTCEVHAWCPVEDGIHMPYGGTKALLTGSKDLTVLIKNTIEFPAFGRTYSKRNIDHSMTENYLQACINDPKKDPLCPTFRVEDIVTRSGFKFDDVATTGGIFAVTITWNCDFDFGKTMKHCLPQYSCSRMDNAQTKIAPGWNFRSTSYHDENRRTLTQQYGIKILVEVDGEGRKFDSVKFLFTIGAGLGLFSVASLVCDNLLSLFCTLKEFFSSHWLAFFDSEMKYDLRYVARAESKHRKCDIDMSEQDTMTLDMQDS